MTPTHNEYSGTGAAFYLSGPLFGPDSTLELTLTLTIQVVASTSRGTLPPLATSIGIRGKYEIRRSRPCFNNCGKLTAEGKFQAKATRVPSGTSMTAGDGATPSALAPLSGIWYWRKADPTEEVVVAFTANTPFAMATMFVLRNASKTKDAYAQTCNVVLRLSRTEPDLLTFNTEYSAPDCVSGTILFKTVGKRLRSEWTSVVRHSSKPEAFGATLSRT